MSERARAYVRVSGRKQAASGLGLEAQRQAVEDSATRLGLELVEIHEDAAVSGRKSLEHRPALFDAIQALEKGDVLIVAKRCRLGRDVVEVGLIERQIAKRGARLVSAAGEGSEGNDPTALFLRRILDAVNELEVAQTRARTRAALRAKRRRGECAGTVPFGCGLAVDGRTLVENASELAVIAAVREAKANGLSQRAIVADLKARGFLGRTGRPFGRSQVRGMLTRLAAA